MKLEFSRRIFEKYSATEFHANTYSGKWVVPSRQRDRRTDITKLGVAYRNFCELQFKILALSDEPLNFARYVLGRLPEYRSRYCDSLRAGRFGIRTPVVTRFCRPVHSNPGWLGLRYRGHWVSFPRGGGLCCRGLALWTHPPWAPRLSMGRPVPLSPLRDCLARNKTDFTFVLWAYVTIIGRVMSCLAKKQKPINTAILLSSYGYSGTPSRRTYVTVDRVRARDCLFRTPQ